MKMATPEPDTRPLGRNDVLVLTVLADGPSYAYEIAQALEARTEGAVRLRPGNLYRVIERLESQGLVRESAHRPDEGDDRRRYFAITRPGRDAARAEIRMLTRMAIAGGLWNEATDPA